MEIAETISDKIATRFFFKKSIPSLLSASDKGRAMLLELEEKRRKEAEDKRQQRFQNQVSVAQVLVPCITFVTMLALSPALRSSSGGGSNSRSIHL